jgi:hypothetical protein
MNDFSKKIKESDSIELIQAIFCVINLNKINSFPLDKVMDSLFYNLKTNNNIEASERTYSIVTNIDFIEKNYKLIRDRYDLYYNENKELLNRFNVAIDNITKDISHKRRLNINPDSPLYSFYLQTIDLQKRLIDKQIQNNKETGSTALKRSTLINEYIIPIKILANKVENSANYEYLQETMLFLHNLENVLIDYGKINDFGYLFESMISEMKVSRDKLNESNQYFKEHKIKSYLCVK